MTNLAYGIKRESKDDQVYFESRATVNRSGLTVSLEIAENLAPPAPCLFMATSASHCHVILPFWSLQGFQFNPYLMAWWGQRPAEGVCSIPYWLMKFCALGFYQNIMYPSGKTINMWSHAKAQKKNSAMELCIH